MHNIKDDRLKSIAYLANKQKNLEALIDQKEQELHALRSNYKQVSGTDLPELMREIGIGSFKLDDGSQISIKHDLSASVKVEDKIEVYTWLKANNFGSIIKANVVASFEMNESEKADKIFEDLLEKGINATKKEEIHFKTFSKFVKECLEEGINLPDKINIYPFSEAKIT